jgi:hypothetical protein
VTVAERIDRIGEHLRIRLPDAGPPRHYHIARSLVQIKDLLDEIAAAMPSVRAERAGTSEDAVGPEPEAGVDRDALAAVPGGGPLHPPAVLAAPPRMLAGVVHSGSGDLLGGAAVLLTDSSGKQVARTRTSGDGSYRVIGVPEGRYIAVASAEFHEPEATTVTLRCDRTARLEFVLTPQHLVARETARLRAGEPTTLDLMLARAAGGVPEPTSNGHRDGSRGELVVSDDVAEVARRGQR